jgi:hypothetical protein
VSDVRCARPAGRLFSFGGNLYRPAQDCSGGYGSAIQMQKVVRLTKDEYREESAWGLRPERGFVAMHTLSVEKEWAVVDEQRRVFPWQR